MTLERLQLLVAAAGAHQAKNVMVPVDVLADLIAAVERCKDIRGALAGDRLVNVGNSTVHYAYHKAVAALAPFTEPREPADAGPHCHKDVTT